MRTILIGAMLLVATSSASAQLLGPRGPVGATTGTIDRTVGGIDRATGDTTRIGNDATHDVARDRSVRVAAGASIRVERGTRCYYDDYYYDPVYRDGTYYCERSGTQVGGGAGVRTRP